MLKIIVHFGCNVSYRNNKSKVYKYVNSLHIQIETGLNNLLNASKEGMTTLVWISLITIVSISASFNVSLLAEFIKT